MKSEIQITIDEFKLIKSFYPEFTRKKEDSNDFVIGWSELMPVVEKIESLGPIRFMIEKNRVMVVWAEPEYFWNSGTTSQTKLQTTYDAVTEFIKWYNENKGGEQ
jgi:hypothetical protein